MWQRLQTLFLALVVLIMVASIFLPIWRHVDESGVRHELYPLHYSIIEQGPNGEMRTAAYIPFCVTAIFMVAAATLAAMTIRRYDNRITQIKMGAFNLLLLMGALISAVYFSNKMMVQYNTGGGSKLALWTIFAAVACNWIAIRLIRRDEKLVRDSDRLR